MQIDFDNFRRQSVEAFNRLCAELNGRIHGNPLCVGDIRDEMNALRDCIVTLICLEDKRDGDGIECLDVEVSEFAPEE